MAGQTHAHQITNLSRKKILKSNFLFFCLHGNPLEGPFSPNTTFDVKTKLSFKKGHRPGRIADSLDQRELVWRNSPTTVRLPGQRTGHQGQEGQVRCRLLEKNHSKSGRTLGLFA